jgi:hypothetical protein
MRQLSIKQTALEVVKSLPENSTLEEIMYQINLAAQTLKGLKDIQDNKTISTTDLLEKADQWKVK